MHFITWEILTGYLKLCTSNVAAVADNYTCVIQNIVTCVITIMTTLIYSRHRHAHTLVSFYHFVRGSRWVVSRKMNTIKPKL